MADLNEIKTAFDEVQKTFAALRSDVDAVKNRDVVDETKFDKMTAEITEKMEAIQKEQQKTAAMLERGNLDGGNDAKKAEAEAREKLNEFARKGDKGSLEIRAMSTDSNPNGGYLVMPELSATVVSRIFETSPLRLVANVEQTGAKSRDFLIDDDEGTAEWSGEKAVASEDTPQVGMKSIVAHDITAKMTATADMLEDAYLDLSAWLQNKGADKIGRTENTAFVVGDGVNKPRGFLDYGNYSSPGVYQRDAIEQVISGAATTFTAEGLIDLTASLKEAYQANAVWMMQRASYGAVLKLKGADNFYFGPTFLKDGTPTMQILGKRVIFADDMEAIGTGGNLIAAYGDFRAGYTILDRIGLQVLRDPYTADPYTIFRLRRRTGGDVTNFEAIKLLRAAAS